MAVALACAALGGVRDARAAEPIVSTFDELPEGLAAAKDQDFVTPQGITIYEPYSSKPGASSSKTVCIIDNQADTMARASAGNRFKDGATPPNVLSFGGYSPGPGGGSPRFKSVKYRIDRPAVATSIDLYYARYPRDVDTRAATVTLALMREGRVVHTLSARLENTNGATRRIRLALSNEVFDNAMIYAGSPDDDLVAFMTFDNLSVTPADDAAIAAARAADAKRPAQITTPNAPAAAPALAGVAPAGGAGTFASNFDDLHEGTVAPPGKPFTTPQGVIFSDACQKLGRTSRPVSIAIDDQSQTIAQSQVAQDIAGVTAPNLLTFGHYRPGGLGTLAPIKSLKIGIGRPATAVSLDVVAVYIPYAGAPDGPMLTLAAIRNGRVVAIDTVKPDRREGSKARRYRLELADVVFDEAMLYAGSLDDASNVPVALDNVSFTPAEEAAIAAARAQDAKAPPPPVAGSTLLPIVSSLDDVAEGVVALAGTKFTTPQGITISDAYTLAGGAKKPLPIVVDNQAESMTNPAAANYYPGATSPNVLTFGGFARGPTGGGFSGIKSVTFGIDRPAANVSLDVYVVDLAQPGAPRGVRLTLAAIRNGRKVASVSIGGTGRIGKVRHQAMTLPNVVFDTAVLYAGEPDDQLTGVIALDNLRITPATPDAIAAAARTDVGLAAREARLAQEAKEAEARAAALAQAAKDAAARADATAKPTVTPSRAPVTARPTPTPQPSGAVASKAPTPTPNQAPATAPTPVEVASADKPAGAPLSGPFAGSQSRKPAGADTRMSAEERRAAQAVAEYGGTWVGDWPTLDRSGRLDRTVAVAEPGRTSDPMTLAQRGALIALVLAGGVGVGIWFGRRSERRRAADGTPGERH
ncbi:MAG: hypothetical protein GC159_12405 [Phycisphaera sp.]|nr:hypothetical protein [Phycisphaera sp.]